jgi:hypothetical protein
MLARNRTSKIGKPIPTEWLESLNRLLNDTYKSECNQSSRYFDVFGEIYENELLVVISYLSEKDEYLSPITLFLSSGLDQIATETKIKETQKNFIDLAGLFFDEIFSSDDWDEFEPHWQEVTHHHQNYFYKITRENINMTIEANRLLGKEFLDEEEDGDLLDN